jgi:hypothetical protein
MISILSGWVSFLTYPNLFGIKGFVVVVVVVVVVRNGDDIRTGLIPFGGNCAKFTKHRGQTKIKKNS